MEFWIGVLTGSVAGACAGVVIAALLSGCKRGADVTENGIASGDFLRWFAEEKKKYEA